LFTDLSGRISKGEDVASLDKPAGETKLVSYDVDVIRVMLCGKAAVVTDVYPALIETQTRIVIRTSFTDVFVKS
jgi:hypothetical protein